jgi:hypothetical protein
MELFRAEKIADVETNSSPNKCCPVCDRKLELLRTILYSDTGDVIRAFECECGQRIWDYN